MPASRSSRDSLSRWTRIGQATPPRSATPRCSRRRPAADGGHYFLEMNTRLQVEHGITELVTGLDLVASQILVASGEPLSQAILEAIPRGHAIEVRIYAEDPYAGFRPVGGMVTTWRLPSAPGVRIDEAVRPGFPLTSAYDPLLAQLMVHAGDRPAAFARLRRGPCQMLVCRLQTHL